MAEKEADLIEFDKVADLALFEEDKVEVLLERIDEKMGELIGEADADTKDGRDTIRTVVHNGVLTRGVVVKAVNAKTEGWRISVKTLNAARDKFVATSLKNEAKHKKPLVDFENIDKARIANHKTSIELMSNLTDDIEPYTAEEIKKRLDTAESVEMGEGWEEFQDQATELKATVVSSLQMSYDARKKYEDDQAELESLRQKQIARDKKDEEDRLRQEGEAKAKKEADERIAAETTRVEKENAHNLAMANAEAERVKNEAAAAVEREAKAIQAKKDAEAREEQAKKDAKIAAEKAEADRIQAEKDAEVAKRRAADEAAEKAMREQAAEKLRLAREAEAREADKAHHAEINNAAVDCLITGLKIDVDLAKSIVVLIASKKVSNVTISY